MILQDKTVIITGAGPGLATQRVHIVIAWSIREHFMNLGGDVSEDIVKAEMAGATPPRTHASNGCDTIGDGFDDQIDIDQG